MCLSAVLLFQLVVLAKIEKDYPLVYSMSSFITVCSIILVSVCFYLIQNDLNQVCGPKLLNSQKDKQIFRSMYGLIMGAQIFQLIIVSRCGVKEVPTIAYSLHLAGSSNYVQISYYLIVDCLIPVSYMFIYKSRLSRSQKATFNKINSQQTQ